MASVEPTVAETASPPVPSSAALDNPPTTTTTTTTTATATATGTAVDVTDVKVEEKEIEAGPIMTIDDLLTPDDVSIPFLFLLS
jgi:hypothetical protein